MFRQTSDLETQATSESRAKLGGRLRSALIASALLIFGLFGLAAIIQVSGAVVGFGEVKVESNVKKVAHPTGGVVAEVLVRNGDSVSAGDAMIRLDTTVSGTSAQVMGRSVDQLLAQKARLEAQASGRSVLLFPSELLRRSDGAAQQAMADERRQFQLERQERAATLAQLNDRIVQSEEQIRGYERQVIAVRKQATLIQPELKGVRELWHKNLVTINRLNQLERTAVDLEGTEGALMANIAQTRARISETRQQMIQVGQDERSQAGRQLPEVIARLNEQEVRKVSAGDQFERSMVRAPADGVVDKLAFTNVGAVISPTEPIAEIVPVADAKIVEAQISVADIDQVRIGQPADISFSAFSAQTTPKVEGRVKWVSAEREIEQTTGRTFYKVRITVDAAGLAKLKGLKLVPGMPAEVYIRTAERSLLSYLTKPLRDQMSRAFRENG